MTELDPQLLDAVVGGRKSATPADVSPKVYEGMAQIAQAVKGAGDAIAQGIVAAKQQSMQMIGQLMQQKMQGGK